MFLGLSRLIVEASGEVLMRGKLEDVLIWDLRKSRKGLVGLLIKLMRWQVICLHSGVERITLPKSTKKEVCRSLNCRLDAAIVLTGYTIIPGIGDLLSRWYL